MVIYIDNIVLDSKINELTMLIKFLQTYYKVTIKDKLSFMLYIEIQHHIDTITLEQLFYIQ